MWAESSLWKASVQSISLSVEEMGNSWSGSNHSLTSQVTPSEPPHSLTKRKLLLLAETREVWGDWQLWHCTESWKKRWRRRVV